MKVSFLHTLFAVGGSLLLAAGSAFAQIPTFASADLVLGQTDFTSNTVLLDSATTLTSPYGVAIDPTTGKVFVSEIQGNRIVRYASETALANGAAAEAVFGQADFMSDDGNAGAGFGNPSRHSLQGPSGMFVDPSGRLWVADFNNSRVLMWVNASVLGNNPAADLVLGQSDFTTHAPDTTADRMRLPFGVWIDPAGDLWVADRGNNRVLRFADAANLSNGAAAVQVIGQSNFTNGGGTAGAARLFSPQSVMEDPSGRLWVADSSNSRIVAYDDAATRGNGPDADLVIGQPDFNTTAAGGGSIGLEFPRDAVVDAFGALWVADVGNNRILRYDNIAAAGNQPLADGAVGQPSLFTDTPGIAANRLSLDQGLGLYLSPTGSLWVADASNNRALRFTRPVDPTPTPVPPPALTADTKRPALQVRGRKAIETLRKRVVIRGTTSDASGIADLDVKARGGKVTKAKVKGNGTFKVVLRISKDSGRVIVKLRATDGAGLKSKRAKVRILRR